MKYFDLMDRLNLDVISVLRKDEFGVCGFIVIKSQKQKGSIPIFISNREDELNLLQEALERAKPQGDAEGFNGSIVLSPLENFPEKRKEAFRYLASLMMNFKNISVIPSDGVTLEDMRIIQEVNPYIVQDAQKRVSEVSLPESRL